MILDFPQVITISAAQKNFKITKAGISGIHINSSRGSVRISTSSVEQIYDRKNSFHPKTFQTVSFVRSWQALASQKTI